jgi:hypothetical protein
MAAKLFKSGTKDTLKIAWFVKTKLMLMNSCFVPFSAKLSKPCCGKQPILQNGVTDPNSLLNKTTSDKQPKCLEL